MDPDATLNQIRELTQAVLTEPDDSLAEQLAEKVQALDEWVSRGGFLPTDWNALR